MSHSVSVAGVVTDTDGRILVMRRADSGEWQIPGGVLEHGEPLEDGVRREIWEETGIEVRVDTLSGVYHHLLRNVVALVYRCTPVGGTPTPSEESTEVCWLDPETVLSRLAPVFTVRVADAVNGAGAASRNHDGRQLVGDRR